MQNRNRPTDTEIKLVVTKEENKGKGPIKGMRLRDTKYYV